jgi:predicted DNA-binding transcriptional regulator AlpA
MLTCLPRDKDVVTFDEFCAVLDVSRTTLFKSVRNKSVPEPIRLGSRCYRWPRSVVEDFLAQRRVSA